MALDRTSVFVDTNVLVSAALRDIMMELALDDLIDLFWSPQVILELKRALAKRVGAIRERIDHMIAEMTRALPGASIVPDTRRELHAVLPDSNDNHVLLAALTAESSILLTFNLKDFPAQQLRMDSDTLTAMHPDAFVVHMLTTQAPAVLVITARIRASLTRPPLSVDAYVTNLARSGLPNTAMLLRPLLTS